VQPGTGIASGPELRSLGDNPQITSTATGSDHASITARFTTLSHLGPEAAIVGRAGVG
jgi:hypothetical protein